MSQGGRRKPGDFAANHGVAPHSTLTSSSKSSSSDLSRPSLPNLQSNSSFKSLHQHTMDSLENAAGSPAVSLAGRTNGSFKAIIADNEGSRISALESPRSESSSWRSSILGGENDQNFKFGPASSNRALQEGLQDLTPGATAASLTDSPSSRKGHRTMNKSWDELRELSSSLLLDETMMNVASLDGKDPFELERQDREPSSQQLIFRNDAIHGNDAGGDTIDAWPLDSNKANSSTIVHLHRSGSFTISSPRGTRSSSGAGGSDMEETKGDTSIAELGSHWKSALTVTSLHKSYLRLLSEQRSLKDALHASERRCAELLRIAQDADAQHAQNERDQALANSAQSQAQDHALEVAKNRISDLEQELASITNAKSELIHWKQQHLALEQESLGALREALHESHGEKSEMEKSLQELQEMTKSQQKSIERHNASAPRILRGILLRWQRARVYSAWKTWLQFVADVDAQQRSEHTAELALQRMRRRELFKSISTWRHFTQHRRRTKQVQQSIIFRMKHRAASQSMTSWKIFTLQQQNTRSVLRRLASLVLHRNFARAFWTWERRTKEISRLEHLARLEEDLKRKVSRKHDAMLALADICVARWQGDLQRMVLLTWKENAAVSKQQRCFYFFMQWKTNAGTNSRERRIMERAVSRLRNRKLNSVFQTWNTNVQAQLACKAKIGCFLGRWRNARLSSYFERWSTFASDSIRKKERARGILAILRQDVLAIRFYDWVDEVAFRREQRAVGDQEEARTHALLLKFAAHWKHRALSRVFERWTEVAQRRRYLRRFLQRMERQSQYQDLYAAFQKLKLLQRMAMHAHIVKLEAALASAQSELKILQEQSGQEISNLAKEKANQREHHLHHVVGLMRNRQLARAFNQFKMNVSKLVHDRRVLRTFVEKWRHRRSFQVLSSWQTFVTKRKFLRKFLDNLLRDKTSRLITTSFRTWNFNTTTGYQASLKEKITQDASLIESLKEQLADLISQRDALSARYDADVKRFQEQRNDACRRLATKLAVVSDSQMLQNCFRAMKINSEQGRRDRIIMQRFSQRWKNQTMSRAFTAWVASIQEMKSNRKLLHRFAIQLQKANLAASFRSWSLAARERKANRAKVLMFFRRQEQQTFWRCFEHWKIFTTDSVAQKERAQSLFATLMHEGLRSRFHQWVLYVRDVKEAREELIQSEKIVERVMIRMRKGTISRAFSSWHAHTCERRAHRERVFHFIQRWRMRSAAQAFDTWLDNARDRQRLRALVHKCLLRMDSSLLYSAFRKWASFASKALFETVNAYAREVAELQTQLGQLEWERQALETNLGDQLRSVVAHRDRIREKHADSVMYTWRNHLMLMVFQHWQLMTKEIKRKRLLVTRFLARLTQQRKAKSFSGWVSRVQEQKRQRHLVFIGVSRLRERTLARSFASFKNVLALRQKRQRAATLMMHTIRRLLQARLARAWRTWLGSVLHHLKNNEVVARGQTGILIESMRERCVRVSVASWQKIAMAKALATWKSQATALKAQKRRTGTFICRWRNMRAAAAWRGWRSFISEEKQKREALRSLILRWRKQKLALGIRTWVSSTNMSLVIKLRESSQESIVLACWQKGRIATLARCVRAWAALAHARLTKIRATKKLMTFVKRMRSTALLRALNKWKLVASEKYSQLYHFKERNGIVGAIQNSLVQIVCNAVLFPSLSGLAAESSFSYKHDTHATTLLHRQEPMLHQNVIPAQRRTSGLCGVVWGAVMQAMGSGSHHLFSSDALQVFEVVKDTLVQYDHTGSLTKSSPAGSSLTAYTIRLRQTVALQDASTDPRFNPDIDTPHLRFRNLVSPLSGPFGISGIASPPMTPNSPSAFSMSSGPMGDFPSVSLVCVPIFGTEDQVIGLIQASRTPRNYHGSNYQVPDDHYLDATVGVLSVAADSISVVLQWASSLEQQDYQVDGLRGEADGLHNNLEVIEQAKERLERKIHRLEQDASSSTSHLTKQLRAAQRKINQLQTRATSVSRIEAEVKRLLDHYDSVMEKSASVRPVSSPTSPSASDLDVQDLRQLQAEQQSLLKQLDGFY